MLHFQMCNILKFIQSSLVVLIPYLLINSQQFFVTTLLRHIAFMSNVFCFNGFNQAPIVLRYSAHIKPRKRLKPLNHTTFTHISIHTLTVYLSVFLDKQMKSRVREVPIGRHFHAYICLYYIARVIIFKGNGKLPT